MYDIMFVDISSIKTHKKSFSYTMQLVYLRCFNEKQNENANLKDSFYCPYVQYITN